MRVNIYAEEMTDRVEIVTKTIDGVEFEALRFYLYLPVTKQVGNDTVQVQGPFIHREEDDDSAAVTFWSRGQLRSILAKAIDLLDAHHNEKNKKPHTQMFATQGSLMSVRIEVTDFYGKDHSYTIGRLINMQYDPPPEGSRTHVFSFVEAPKVEESGA